MMGKSHLTVGACAIAVVACTNIVPWRTPAILIASGGLILAGTVYPDIDHLSSSVTRSWGWLTWLISHVVRFCCRWIYRSTRLPNDPARKDPHRTFTHTVPGALLAGLLVAASISWDRNLAIALFAMLFGTVARCVKKSYLLYGAVAGGALGYGAYGALATAWWALGLAFSAGCVLHVWSDCVTKSGAPLSFPRITLKKEMQEDGSTKVLQRRRWHMSGPPEWMRFYTGGVIETWVIRLMISMTVCVCYLLEGGAI